MFRYSAKIQDEVHAGLTIVGLIEPQADVEMTPKVIDSCKAAFHELRWSCGDRAFWTGQSIFWQVYAHKYDDRIVVRAGAQTEASEAALNQTRRLQ